MNKVQFLSELSYQLRRLPEEERTEAIRYYDEYISDAEDEAAALAALGAPGYVAAQIIAGWVGDMPAVIETTSSEEQQNGYQGSTAGQEQKKKTSAFRVFWIVLLAVFASPIALPVAISIVVVAISIVLVLITLVIGIVVGGIGAVVSGALALVAGFGVASLSGWSFLMMLGAGLAAIGLGIILVMVGAIIARHGVGRLVRWLSKSISRRFKK